MKLTQQPETEIQYWQMIESLGGFIWSMNHDFHHGRISTKEWEESVGKDVEDAREISKQLVSEIQEKFGIVMTKDEVVEGKTFYWDWYNKQKEEWMRAEYEKHICSACCLSTHDLDRFATEIPCSVFHGMMYRLSYPHQCGMLRDWTKEKLLNEMLAKGGQEEVIKFLNKEKELTEAFNKERG